MYTSFVFFALAGVLINTPTSREPQLLRDYDLARRVGVNLNKPLAVFIGSGQSGWEGVCLEGKLEKEVQDLLSRHYICLYVDVAQQSGRQLADSFEVPDGPGLVLSSRSGKVQAFRHEGRLSNSEIGNYLRRFSDPEVLVQHTERRSVETVSLIRAAEASTTAQPAPVVNVAAPVYLSAPAPLTISHPVFAPISYSNSVFRSGSC